LLYWQDLFTIDNSKYGQLLESFLTFPCTQNIIRHCRIPTFKKPPRKLFDIQFKRQAENLLEPAGISIDGKNAWDIKVHDSRLFQRILAHGNLGFGEAYMDGWWDCDAIDELFNRILHKRINKKIGTFGAFASSLAGRIFNLQIPSRAFTIGERHDLFTLMLDPGMNYSCAYWENSNNLEQAQEKKLQPVFDKLELKRGMKVLDIGCGWGGAAQPE
jgi:cyclopropane-fatty-acyl-phospholipid synthase